MRTQQQQVLKHLKRGPITRKQADEKYGIVNLYGRIYDLKRRGFEIADEWIKAPNRFGRICRVKRYRLVA